MKPITPLRTKLSIEECKTRLDAGISNPFDWKHVMRFRGDGGSKQFSGILSGDRFEVSWWQSYRDHGAYVFRGQLVESKDGTIIEGKFELKGPIQILMLLGAFVIGSNLILMGMRIFHSGDFGRTDGNGIKVLILVGIAVIGSVPYLISRYVGPSEQRRILAFLKYTLKADECPS